MTVVQPLLDLCKSAAGRIFVRMDKFEKRRIGPAVSLETATDREFGKSPQISVRQEEYRSTTKVASPKSPTAPRRVRCIETVKKTRILRCDGRHRGEIKKATR